MTASNVVAPDPPQEIQADADIEAASTVAEPPKLPSLKVSYF